MEHFPNSSTQILHHLQERVALLQMVRVLAAHRAAKTRSLRKVPSLHIFPSISPHIYGIAEKRNDWEQSSQSFRPVFIPRIRNAHIYG